jgi:hypothetical protein
MKDGTKERRNEEQRKEDDQGRSAKRKIYMKESRKNIPPQVRRCSADGGRALGCGIGCRSRKEEEKTSKESVNAQRIKCIND